MSEPTHSPVPLAGLSVGMWKRKNTATHSLHFTIIPEAFVFFCERYSHTHRFENASTFIGARSPFSSKLYHGRRCVFAFEVSFSDVVGLDYSNPLLQSGKLVIDAHNIRRREFPSIDDAIEYYNAASIQNDKTPPKTPDNRSPSLEPYHIEATARPKSARGDLMHKLQTSALTFALRNKQKDDGVDNDGATELTFRALAVEPSEGGSSSNGTPRLVDSIDLPPNERPLHHVASAPTAVGQPTTAIKVPRLHLNKSENDVSTLLGSDESPFPSPHAFDSSTVHVYNFRQITVTFDDPEFSHMLKPVIESNEKLLKLYESGLPVWSKVMPQYGLYYRPWLRSFTWVLFYAFSFFSLAAGFYDLYKTLPGLQDLLQRSFSAIWLPGAALLDWFEDHTRIRLSILLTYLFGKSELFVVIMRWLSTATRVVRAAAQPITDIIGPPLEAIVTTLKLTVGQFGSVLFSLAITALSPITYLITTIQASISNGLLPIIGTVSTVIGTAFVHLQSTFGVLWAAIVELSKTFGAVQATATAASASSSWSSALSSEALHVLRESLTRAARSMQAVWKFIVHMASSAVRHRITLSRRARRQWMRVKTRTGSLIVSGFHGVVSILKYLVLAIMLLFAEKKTKTAEAVEQQGADDDNDTTTTRTSTDQHDEKKKN